MTSKANCNRLSFWCEKCEQDYDLEGMVDSILGERYFRAVCPRFHKVVRYIENKQADPYFARSRKLRMQRQKLSKDIIQPGQTGFETYYKKEYDKIERAKESWDIKQEEKKKKMEEYYKKMKEDMVSNKTINRAIELEHAGT